ncbi:MAG: peptidoglycan-associated lipoprotein Pal [Gammaproteobacteria bacterium]|nr:peptidoglycan-associated lipoprotein Pal [Gammaproteobacteria bacterium]MBT4493048.1 peptidoglycan-associated lipoprotein Pal [Gammaproteobacteria bacterium]MBT7371696.1 peptidoglycan-associated lipoprotein Pal [Gammaproteobacteria bacterium]
MEPMEQAPELGAGSDDEASTEPAGPVIEDGKVIIPVDDGMGGEMTEMLNGVFYFDFDQAIVKRSGHGELDKHASVLSGDRYIRVRLEGHADERGTREYNLALGERRANAVRAYLVAQGASRSQIEVISYGEEKPDNTGHNESAWAQNRRVEIVYR